ncbi:unnamed protein product [Sphenostylis stenocarpa]|uniref:Uncharacterized protein n=1 Tax=Sphenostylis stenocarpa TaxID=92480 RepID=A0AA86SES8_9FABA|nr:unnamed protein product [Sphenostylis stenocarpa]
MPESKFAFCFAFDFHYSFIDLLMINVHGLYLGSIGTAINKAALKDHNISHILTVAGRIPPAHPEDFVYKIIDGVSWLLIEFAIHNKWDNSVRFRMIIVFACNSERACFGP